VKSKEDLLRLKEERGKVEHGQDRRDGESLKKHLPHTGEGRGGEMQVKV